MNTRLAGILLSIGMVVAFDCAASRPPTIEQIESWVTARPAPEYPADALRRGEAGAGVVTLHFNIKTGTVRTIQLTQSTGHRTLDAAAIRAFRQWRFKAGALPPIRNLNRESTKPFANEDFVVKVPFTFLLASGGRVNVGGPGAAR